eukprot:6248806-Alexandrium_andersonii.AAC.1
MLLHLPVGLPPLILTHLPSARLAQVPLHCRLSYSPIYPSARLAQVPVSGRSVPPLARGSVRA